MLKDCFACAEWSGSAERSAFSDRERSVDDALRSYKLFGRKKPFSETERELSRPHIDHVDRADVSFLVFDRRDLLFYCVFAGSCYRFYDAFSDEVEGNHDLVLDVLFWNPAEEVCSVNDVADFSRRIPLPFDVAGKGRKVDTSFKEVTCRFRDILERILKTVEDSLQKSRSKFDGEKIFLENDLVAVSDAVGRLEDLDFRFVSVDLDDLAFKRLSAGFDENNFVLTDRSVESYGDKVALRRNDYPFGFFIHLQVSYQ